jgi:hypothetical protein
LREHGSAGAGQGMTGRASFVISTSIGRLRVAECTLCGALVVQDDGQLQHIRHHAATDTLRPDEGRPVSAVSPLGCPQTSPLPQWCLERPAIEAGGVSLQVEARTSK